MICPMKVECEKKVETTLEDVSVIHVDDEPLSLSVYREKKQPLWWSYVRYPDFHPHTHTQRFSQKASHTDCGGETVNSLTYNTIHIHTCNTQTIRDLVCIKGLFLFFCLSLFQMSVDIVTAAVLTFLNVNYLKCTYVFLWSVVIVSASSKLCDNGDKFIAYHRWVLDCTLSSLLHVRLYNDCQ